MTKPLSDADCLAFLEALSCIVSGGVASTPALEAMLQSTQSRSQKLLFDRDLFAALRNGRLAAAMLDRKLYPRPLVALVEAAECTGEWERLLPRLIAAYRALLSLQTNAEERRFTLMRLGFVFAGAVGLFLFLELPLMTHMTSSLGAVSSIYMLGFILAGLLPLAFLALYFTFCRRLTQDIDDATLRGRARFFFILDAMLAVGYPLETILRLCRESETERDAGNRFNRARRAMESGTSWTEALLAAELIPRETAELLAIGTATGQLLHVTERLATQAFLDWETDARWRLEKRESRLMGLFAGGLAFGLLFAIFPLLGVSLLS